MHPFRHISKTAFTQHRTSAAALVAANVLPLLGVLFLGWSTFAIVALYWFENVVIGVINVLKMVTCRVDADETEFWAKYGAKFFFVPFFIFHYGLFCFVHGAFVLILLGGYSSQGGAGGLDDPSYRTQLLIAAVGLAISHLVSFFTNYLGNEENLRTNLPDLMHQPYGRIMVLHIAIVLGAFVTIALGSPVFLLVIFIVGKTLMDLNLHLRQHESKKSETGEIY